MREQQVNSLSTGPEIQVSPIDEDRTAGGLCIDLDRAVNGLSYASTKL